MDYRITKQNKIIYCILDNIETQSSTTSKEIARNVSDYLLAQIMRRSYDIIIDDNSDKILKRASLDEFYSHAVVMITGTHLGLSERLFDNVEDKCKEHFSIAGHILERGDSYYEIHNQFFIINLLEYKRLGFPDIGQVSWNEEHSKIEPIRSEECIRGDSEIPVWIKEGTTEKTYKNKRHGWNLINVGLMNNAIFTDVGDKIRESKTYLYYEYDHVFLRHLPYLFNLTLVCNTMVTPWNSDSLPKELTVDDDIDHYVTTGTGLNWIFNLLNLGYHQKTKITFTDSSYPVLCFMKALIEEWDGTDYASFYMEQLKFVPDSYKIDLINHEIRIRQWFKVFEKEFDNFQEVWKSLQKLRFDFKLIDFFVNNDFNFINSNEVTFVNVSDVFNHVPFIPLASVKFRVSRENNLIESLKKINKDIYLNITARTGHFYKKDLTDDDKRTFGKVSDFKLWDINEFKSPPWQNENWKSYCPLSGEVRILK
jgi:hypothetical protein